MAKTVQGNLDWRQIKAASRQGDGNKGLAYSGVDPTPGNILVAAADGSAKDSGVPASGGILWGPDADRPPAGIPGRIYIPLDLIPPPDFYLDDGSAWVLYAGWRPTSGGKGSDFAPHDLTSDSSHSPFVISASSHYPGLDEFLAFDGVTSGSGCYWLGAGHGTDWLKIDLGAGQARKLYSYAIKVNDIGGGEPNRAPKTWTMEASDDDATWITVDTRAGETAWASGERREYVCALVTLPYRYFRLNITANNGDADYTDVAELYLYESL